MTRLESRKVLTMRIATTSTVISNLEVKLNVVDADCLGARNRPRQKVEFVGAANSCKQSGISRIRREWTAPRVASACVDDIWVWKTEWEVIQHYLGSFCSKTPSKDINSDIDDCTRRGVIKVLGSISGAKRGAVVTSAGVEAKVRPWASRAKFTETTSRNVDVYTLHRLQESLVHVGRGMLFRRGDSP